MALGYRTGHPPGSVAYQFDSTSGDAYTYEFATEKQTVDGKPADVVLRDASGVPKPKLDAAGKPVPFQIAYPDKDEKGNFLSHANAGLGGRNAQLRLDVRSGHHRHSDSRRIRIGDGHGRRGQRPEAPHSHCGSYFAAGAGGSLLFL